MWLYCVFTHGLVAYDFLCTLPNISDFLQPLDFAISNEFIPALTGRSVSDLEKDLFTLPVWTGGLELVNPSVAADFKFNSFKSVTLPLIHLIV